MIHVNLLGLPKAKKRAPMVTFQAGTPLYLLLAVLVVVVGVQYFRYGRLQAEDKRLILQIQKDTQDKARLEGIRSEYERFSAQKELLTKRINIIEGLKAKQSGPSRFLTMIASTVSNTDGLWLTNFEQAGQKVTIQGEALSAKVVADFLTHLKDSKAFTDIDLKETFQDSTVKELQKFLFTVNALMAQPAPAS